MFQLFKDWVMRLGTLWNVRMVEDQGNRAYSAYFSEQIDKAKDAFEEGATEEAHLIWRMMRARFPDLIVTSEAALNLFIDFGNFDEAEALIQEGRKRYPRHRVVFAAASARLAFRRGDLVEALRRCEVWRKTGLDQPDCYILAAKCLSGLDRHDDAEAMSGQGVAIHPNDLNLHVQFALHAVRRHDRSAALQRWQMISSRFAYPAGPLGQAECLREMGRFEEAEAILTDSCERFPMEPRLLAEKAHLATAAGEFEHAAQRWKDVVWRFPYFAPAYTSGAVALRKVGKSEQADELLGVGVTRIRNDLAVHREYAQCAERSGEWLVAAERWAQARQLFPDCAEAREREAAACISAERSHQTNGTPPPESEPEDNVEAAPVIEPVSNADRELDCLEQCRKTRDLVTARGVASRLAAGAVTEPHIIERASLILEELGLLDAAAEVIDQAILRHPDHLWIAVRHAAIAAMRGDANASALRWSHVHHTWPDDAIGLLGLAALRFSQGDHDTAARLYGDAASRFPDNVWAADGVASIAIAKQDWALAATLWRDLLARFPDHSHALERQNFVESKLRGATLRSAAESSQERGNLIEAIARWQAVVDEYPDDVDAYLRIALLNRVLGWPRRAVNALLEAVDRFPDHIQARLELLQVAQDDGDIDLTLRTLSWFRDRPRDEQIGKQTNKALERLLGLVPDFQAFQKAALLAMSDPDDGSSGVMRIFIGEVASAWPDRLEWIKRVCDQAVARPEIERSQLPRLSSCISLLDMIASSPDLSGTKGIARDIGFRAISLSQSNDDLTIEPSRRQAMALLEYLNGFVGDRLMRRYQADILNTGAIWFGDLFGPVAPVFSGCLYYAPPKAFTYRFVINGSGYWLITGLAAQAYPIIAVYDEAREVLLYDGSDTSDGLRGFLGREVHDIRAVASGGTATEIIQPRVVLVSGFGNYAHFMWNELPAMLELERWPMTKIDEIIAVFEPFGSFSQVIRWPAAPPVRMLSDPALGADGRFHEALLFTPGSTIVSTEARERLREVCASNAAGTIPDGRGVFTLWISLRRMYRHATNMTALLTEVVRRLEASALTADILLDGFSPPFDLAVGNRYNTEYYLHHQKIVESEAQNIVAELAPACNHVRIVDTTWATLPTAITIAARADFYICHHGTQQHKIAWMYDIPGLIHANVEISSRNPHGDWVQAQCGSPVRPEYIPARFIGRSLTDNERQDMPDFEDYKFVEIELCADFVFSRIQAAHQVWLGRQ